MGPPSFGIFHDQQLGSAGEGSFQLAFFFLSILNYLFVLFKSFTLESLTSDTMSLLSHVDIFAAFGCLNQMGSVGCTGLRDQEPKI